MSHNIMRCCGISRGGLNIDTMAGLFGGVSLLYYWGESKNQHKKYAHNNQLGEGTKGGVR